MTKNEIKYLKMLSTRYPNIASAATGIINMKAILNLPKATEHFITDLHGEYLQFRNILNNGSGAVAWKIEEEFGNTISKAEKRMLETLISYPEQKLAEMKTKFADQEELEDWYHVTIGRLIRVCRKASSKYTRSKVAKAMPEDFGYIIEELLSSRHDVADQEQYFREIINSAIHTGMVESLIGEMCVLIRRFTVDKLHVVGDIFDRGPYPYLIMEDLMKHHNVDIQWGNHDALWMGAAAGSLDCICNMLRISARYGNLSIVEDAYGISMVPLMRLALDFYGDDPCEQFMVKPEDSDYDPNFAPTEAKMQKAISIIQFKLEGHLIKRHPEWNMEDRLLLNMIDYKAGTIKLGENTYELLDKRFPTIDPADPYKLTPEETDVMAKLRQSFMRSEKLQKHIRFLYAKGSLYKVCNGNLLYHGCVPVNKDGSFMKVNIYGKYYSGRGLYDVLEHYARRGYFSVDPAEKKKGEDILWFMWQNKYSPVYGKDKMATFERSFLAEKETHKENKNYYYKLYEDEEFVDSILMEFGLDPQTGHIINGHVPVEVKKGESPAKCGGKLLVIDGGFSRAYQPKTGIAGYTLIYNSYGLVLAEHEPFTSVEDTVKNETSVRSHIVMEETGERRTVGDTDQGVELRERIAELEELLRAYRSGQLSER